MKLCFPPIIYLSYLLLGSHIIVVYEDLCRDNRIRTGHDAEAHVMTRHCSPRTSVFPSHMKLANTIKGMAAKVSLCLDVSFGVCMYVCVCTY